MSAKNFKFVSPGVFVEEIDNSQLPNISDAIGPVVIGRSRRGPAFIPTTVQSFSEFVTIFGDPVAGQEASDQWRSGVPKAPTFAAYAAQAWLRNNSPLTFVRLLGDQSSRAANETTGKAGWTAADPSQNNGGSVAHGGGAYGLFLLNSASNAGTPGVGGTPEYVTGSLAAVLYTRYGAPILSGSVRAGEDPPAQATATLTAVGEPTTDQLFTIRGLNADGSTTAVQFKATAANNSSSDPITFNKTGTSHGLVDLKAMIEASDLSSLLTVSAVGGSDPFTLTFTQVNGGSAGDTTITSNADNYNFGGGGGADGAFTGGDDAGPTQIMTGSNVLINSLDSNGNYSFKIRFINQGGAAGYTTDEDNPQGVIEEAVINFNRSSNQYIRKVLNTDPTKTNTALVNTTSDRLKAYYLGQTYERAIADTITGDSCYGFIAALGGATNITDGGKFKYATQAARTGWFFSQDYRVTDASADYTNNTQTPAYNPEAGAGIVDRLFKFHTISTGEEEQRRYKISIEDLKYSKNDNVPYGTFTVSIRDIADNDGARVYVERYTNCNLDPSSPNYIAKKIGDRYYEWNEEQRRVIEYGTYPNLSNILRVEMADAVDSSQVNPEALPFGVEGPIKFNDFEFFANSSAFAESDAPPSPVVFGSGSSYPQNFGAVTGSVPGQSALAGQIQVAGVEFATYARPLSASIEFPSVPLRNSASTTELSNPKDAYFGGTFTRSSGSVIYENSMQDVAYPLAEGGQAFTEIANETQISWFFSLDDLVYRLSDGVANTSNGTVFYQSGSRALGSSATAMTGSYKAILDKGYDRFTTPLFGGFNGFDIHEQEPFNQTRALVDGSTETQYAMNYSVRKGIDMFADPEYIEGNILVAPGIVNEGLTTHMITTCESRADALAVIDPKGGYTPSSEDYTSEQTRMSVTHVSDVVNNMTARNLNSSYGATYYPWVRIQDTVSGQSLWAPPSVVALGAMSNNDRIAAPWFAPAGFNRGGLTAGAAGIPVTNVRNKLSSQERDDLYEVNINPIASFPNEGIVIFGQKTLQVTPSALDRINVRRLMIFVKKEISRIASQLLFDPNVQQTWSRFTSEVNPFLNNIKNQFGLEDFRVILDETTTTPDLVDRNVVYAKIFLKPTKAIEFFAIDFVITNSGAGFED